MEFQWYKRASMEELYAFLREHGITPAASQKICLRLAAFVTDQYRDYPLEQRAALLREYQEKWNGKRVVLDSPWGKGRTGTVRHVSVWLRSEKRWLWMTPKPGAPHPFVAMVTWDDTGKTFEQQLDYLKLVP